MKARNPQYYCPYGIDIYDPGTIQNACFKKPKATAVVVVSSSGQHTKTKKVKIGAGKGAARLWTQLYYSCANDVTKTVKTVALESFMPYTSHCTYNYTISDAWIQL